MTDWEVAPRSARVRTKCAEKTSVGLWRQSRSRQANAGNRWLWLWRYSVRACNKNFAQHLLSYPPATNRAKRNLGRLRYSCQRAPEQSINNSWIHGILKL